MAVISDDAFVRLFQTTFGLTADGFAVIAGITGFILTNSAGAAV